MNHIERIIKLKDLLDKSDNRVEFFKKDYWAEVNKSPLESFLFMKPKGHVDRIERATRANLRIRKHLRKVTLEFYNTI